MSEGTEGACEGCGRRGRSQQEKTLVKRKPNHEEQEPEPVSGLSLNDTLCDVILVSKTAIGNREDMKAEGKRSLHQALEMNDLCVKDDESELFVANPPGLAYGRLPAHLEEVERKMEAKEKSLDTITKELKSRQDENIVLQTSVHKLTQSLALYRLSRQRFISTFKRDKLGTSSITRADREIIDNGNNLVHGGDANTDAFLYTGTIVGVRRDTSAFTQLYRLRPEIVETLGK